MPYPDDPIEPKRKKNRKRSGGSVETGEHKPDSAPLGGSAYPWEESYDALCRALEEDATAIEKIVADEDSCCHARELRRERAATLRYVLGLADTLRQRRVLRDRHCQAVG